LTLDDPKERTLTTLRDITVAINNPFLYQANMKGARSLFLAIVLVGAFQLSCAETTQECLASSHENECRNPDTIDPRLFDKNLGSFVSVENEDGG
jgi:hypothetical protein